MSEQPPPIMDHDADGITELDNELPRWWLWLFILSVIWAGCYLFYFHVARIGPSSRAAYETEMTAAGWTSASLAVDDSAAAPSTDAAVVAAGQTLFVKNCIPCHRPDGGGLIGPNLCDNFFIHGPAFADSLRTIREGVVAKGMISWKTVMPPSDIQAVASYIWTLRGTSPANPKAPEGYEPGKEPAALAAPAADTNTVPTETAVAPPATGTT